MWCSDPYLDALKSLGYSVVALPKADLRPLHVLANQGKHLGRLGALSTLFVAGADSPLPPVAENQQAAGVSGQRTGDLSFGLGLSILGNVIAAMGGSKLGLDVQYKQARGVVFEFTDVLEDSIEVLKLDQYLSGADLNPMSEYAAQLLEADELYVTTAILKSKKFSVQALKSDGLPLQVDVPVIQQVVGGNVKVSVAAQATSKVTYEGVVPLGFGFQAYRVYYDAGKYTMNPLKPGFVLKAATAAKGTPLVAASPFVRLHD